MARPQKRNSSPTRSAHKGQHRADQPQKPAAQPKHVPGKSAPAKPQSSNGKFWLYGRHAIEAALANTERKIHRLLATTGAAEKLPRLPKTLQVQPTDSAYLARLLGEDAVHQGLAMEVSPLEEAAIEDVFAAAKEHSLLLVLDQVTDPHNIGAILRSAAAFGADAVVMARDHAPGETATMAKSACGALEITPRVMVTNLARTLEEMKKAGYWVVGLDGTATQALHQHKLSGKVAMVLGAEGKGLRRLTLEHCDLLAKLPISPKMESLNVSNAAAIALYELARDRMI
jgi:23S rRNA (guanosine2251-2'-O)-methyltransferase